MNKTSKLGLIYFICTILLLVNRIINGLLPIGDNLGGWLYSLTSQIIILFLLPWLLYRLMCKKDDIWTDFRIKPAKKLTPTIWLLVVCLAPLMSFATIGISVVWNGLVLPNIGFTSVSSVGTIYSDGWVLVLELFCSAVLPAFCEEFFNRGLMITSLEDKPDGIVKALFVGLMFGLFHQNVAQFAYAIFGGFVFAVLYMKTKSIWPGVLLHFFNNAWGTISDFCSQKGNSLGLLYDKVWDFLLDYFFIALILFVVAFAAVMALLRYIGQLSDKIPDKNPKKDDAEHSLIGVLFGNDVEAQLLPLKGKPAVKLYHYGYMLAAIVVMALTTLMTFIWGVLR